jgi:hypothetical protein
MSFTDKVVDSFASVPTGRPVLVFRNAQDADDFQRNFSGKVVYNKNTHVELPKPEGLELVYGGKRDGSQTSYVFHTPQQAALFWQKLNGYGVMYDDKASAGIVYVGQTHHSEYQGEPIFPGVA